MNQVTQQPIQQPTQQVVQQPVQQVPATQPMPQPSVPPTPEHSHFGLYTVIALLIGATAILGGIVVYSLTGKSQQVAPMQQVMQPQPATQSASVASQMQQVTPEPIATKQNLDTAMQTLNGTDMTQINAGLTQNTQDTSSFSQ